MDDEQRYRENAANYGRESPNAGASIGAERVQAARGPLRDTVGPMRPYRIQVFRGGDMGARVHMYGPFTGEEMVALQATLRTIGNDVHVAIIEDHERDFNPTRHLSSYR